MTAIINCRHSTVKGGFGRIQQQRGKRKTERKPRSKFTMENTTEIVTTQNKQGTPKSTSFEDSLPSITTLIYKAHGRVPWSSVPSRCNTGWEDSGVPCTNRMTVRCLSWATQLEQQRICYAVCINCTSKYTAKIPRSLWKISIRNPTYNCVHIVRRLGLHLLKNCWHIPNVLLSE